MVGAQQTITFRRQHLVARIRERLDERRTLLVQQAHEVGMRILFAAIKPLHQPR